MHAISLSPILGENSTNREADRCIGERSPTMHFKFSADHWEDRHFLPLVQDEFADSDRFAYAFVTYSSVTLTVKVTVLGRGVYYISKWH